MYRFNVVFDVLLLNRFFKFGLTRLFIWTSGKRIEFSGSIWINSEIWCGFD